MEGMMLKLKLQYFGHLMRRVDSLEKTLMLGRIGGRRRMGRLLFQGAHLTHIPKLLDRRQEGGEWSKGNRGHWKVKWGHKGSWGVGG